MLIACPPLAKPFWIWPCEILVVIKCHIVVLSIVARTHGDRVGGLTIQIVLDEIGSRDHREGIAGDPPRPPGGTFFNVGFAPPELFDFETTRFYAWASLTENGEVVAWDYAPDTAWLGGTPRERLGCPPIACPMTGPAPGPGAREWVVSVENQSTRDAHLFVAEDTSPMGELVGTAVPASIPPGASQRVAFSVPDGPGWAIFVNPSPGSGPLITAQDVPMDATGVLPITIVVQPGGMAVFTAP